MVRLRPALREHYNDPIARVFLLSKQEQHKPLSIGCMGVSMLPKRLDQQHMPAQPSNKADHKLDHPVILPHRHHQPREKQGEIPQAMRRDVCCGSQLAGFFFSAPIVFCVECTTSANAMFAAVVFV